MGWRFALLLCIASAGRVGAQEVRLGAEPVLPAVAGTEAPAAAPPAPPVNPRATFELPGSSPLRPLAPPVRDHRRWAVPLVIGGAVVVIGGIGIVLGGRSVYSGRDAARAADRQIQRDCAVRAMQERERCAGQLLCGLLAGFGCGWDATNELTVQAESGLLFTAGGLLTLAGLGMTATGAWGISRSGTQGEGRAPEDPKRADRDEPDRGRELNTLPPARILF